MPPQESFRRLVVATRNAGKLREISGLLAGLPVEVCSLADYPEVPEVPEPHETFAANAAEKATQVARATGHWSLADDSGLLVEALGGAPGVLSARVAGTDAGRITWLLERLEGVAAEGRGACFVCALCLATPDGVLGQWEGVASGVILTEPRGEHGFGYDPVFMDVASGRSFAELTTDQKAALSHRGQALMAFAAELPDLLLRSA